MRLSCLLASPTVPIDPVAFNSAGAVFDALRAGQLDIVFLAVDPLRAEQLAFTEPYVLIEGNFVVAADSAFKSMNDIDRPGVRVAVARGSAYDLFLTRARQHWSACRRDGKRWKASSPTSLRLPVESSKRSSRS